MTVAALPCPVKLLKAVTVSTNAAVSVLCVALTCTVGCIGHRDNTYNLPGRDGML